MKNPTTTTAVDTMTGKDFPWLCREDYPAAAAMVAAALTNAAKHIDNKENAPGVALAYRHANTEELTADTFFHAYDRSDNPKYADLPLLLYIAKAAGKALDAALYQSKKIQLSATELKKYYPGTEDGETPAPDAVIDGRAVQHTYPAPGEYLLQEDTLRRILAEVSPAIRWKAARILVDVVNGYSVSASAEQNKIPPKTALDVLRKVRAAAAIVLEEDGEYARFEKLILSDERTAAAVEKRRAAKATGKETATARDGYRRAAAARAAMDNATRRLDPAAYAAIRATAKPRRVKYGGNMWTDADARAAAAERPAAAVRESYRRTK